MGQQISIKEKVSSYTCYRIDSINDNEIQEFNTWLEAISSRWSQISVIEKKTFINNEIAYNYKLVMKRESNGDYDERYEIPYYGEPIYAILNDGCLNFYTQKEFDTDFEITNENTNT